MDGVGRVAVRVGLAMGLAIVGCGDAATSASGSDPGATASVEASPEPVAAPTPPKEREAVASPQTPEAFVGKHVLVGVGTPLFVAARTDAAKLQLREPASGRAGTTAFEVVGHENGLLKLARAKPEARCDEGLVELDPFDPVLFVEPARVAPVLARESTVSFADGTSVALRPGAAVVQSGANGIADAGGLALSVAIDPRDVATAFTPTMAPRPTESAARVAEGAELRYGEGQSLRAGAALFTDLGGSFIVSRKDEGADTLVEVLNGCATLRVRTPLASLDASKAAIARAGVLGTMHSGLLAEYVVAAGAPVTWPDGSPAGKLASEQRFPESTRGKPKKGKSCFTPAHPEARLEPFTICIAAKHVDKHDPFGGLYAGGAFAGLGTLGTPEDTEIYGGLLGSDIGEAYGGGLGRAEGLGGLGMGGGGGGSGGIGALSAAPDVRVTADALTVEGVLASSTVKAKIAGLKNGVEYCAESASPIATGTLSVSLTVADTGKPSTVTVSGIAAIDGCVQRTLERWKLPKGAGTTTVSFELTIALEDP